MTPVEKQIRNHAMRAQHSARRLRESADMERRAAANLQGQLEQVQLCMARHAALAAEHDKRAAEKDEEQAQWEALLPAAPQVRETQAEIQQRLAGCLGVNPYTLQKTNT